MAQSNVLLADIKNYLDITWDDAAMDEKLTGILARGMRYIDNAGGAIYDYTVESKPRELLFDYVRYARADALDVFQGNYLHELLSLQIQTETGGLDDAKDTGG